jgi:arylsulfatase A-like enzyme
LGLGERALLDKPAVAPAQQPKSPGRDFSPALHGKSLDWENIVFYEMESCRAIRTERWKYVVRHPAGPNELYDMRSDPRERMNLYGQPGLEATRGELDQRLTAFFQQYADPQYDVWRGGRSKARRLVGE